MTHYPDASATGLTFQKSSYSGGNENCVELAQADQTSVIRDSKNPSGPVLAFGHAAYAAFIDAVAAGEFDFDLV